MQSGGSEPQTGVCATIVSDFDETSLTNVENTTNNARFWAHTVVMVIITFGVLYVRPPPRPFLPNSLFLRSE